MNKAELVKAIAAKADLTLPQARKALEAFTSTVTKELAYGGQVNIGDFGHFKTKVRSARNGRNPQTGETILIPEKVLKVFKPGTALKNS